MSTEREHIVEPTRAEPEMSVIVPVHNGAQTLAEQLTALASQAFAAPWETIVVDDGSTDDTVRIAQRFVESLPLRIVELPTQMGAAYARNVGAAVARARKLAFVDADDVVGQGWLSAACAALTEHDVAASRFEIHTLNEPRMAAARSSRQEHGLQEYTYPPFLPHVGGSGLLVRREAHARVGGFDTTLPCLEDTDYAWRLQLAGYGIHFAQNAVLSVRFRTEQRDSFVQSYRYGYYNVVLYKRYRSHGMPKAQAIVGMKRWARLMSPRTLVRLRDPVTRARWVRHVGHALGRLAACVSQRVWAP